MLVLVVACAATAWAIPATQAATAQTSYVDCVSGKDSNAGTSISQAWKSVSRANQANLAPGAKILFKRGCTWSKAPLMVKWNGTASQPITIGAYGTGNKPLFQN